jgi:hypothetical protein
MTLGFSKFWFGSVLILAAEKRAARYLNSLLRRIGLEMVSSGFFYDWQRLFDPWRSAFVGTGSVLAEGGAAYLWPNNPRLVGLSERYKSFDSRVTNTEPVDRRPRDSAGHLNLPR